MYSLEKRREYKHLKYLVTSTTQSQPHKKIGS